MGIIYERDLSTRESITTEVNVSCRFRNMMTGECFESVGTDPVTLAEVVGELLHPDHCAIGQYAVSECERPEDVSELVSYALAPVDSVPSHVIAAGNYDWIVYMSYALDLAGRAKVGTDLAGEITIQHTFPDLANAVDFLTHAYGDNMQGVGYFIGATIVAPKGNANEPDPHAGAHGDDWKPEFVREWEHYHLAPDAEFQG